MLSQTFYIRNFPVATKRIKREKGVWNPLNALIISRIISRNQITVKRGTFDKRLLGFCKVLQENDKRLSGGGGV
jgi:hypothetical protein